MARAMSTASHAVFSHRIVPLASISDPAHVDAIGDGLVAGGLPIVEVALRGDHGMGALSRLAARGDLPWARAPCSASTTPTSSGCGRLLHRHAWSRCERGAIRAGCGHPHHPGRSHLEDSRRTRARPRPSQALSAGVFGGLALVSAYADVFRDVHFMPSGGIKPANLREVLDHRAVFAASRSWITAAAADGAEAVSAWRSARTIAEQS